MAREFVWISPWGDEWNLTTGNRGVHLEQGGQEDFPVVQANESSESVAGSPGELFTGSDIPAAEGSIRALCYSHEGKSVQQVESEFKAAFSRHEDGFLEVRGWVGGALQARCRLSPRLFSAPTRQALHGTFSRVTAHVKAWDGLWEQHQTDMGTAFVSNSGDGIIHPRVRWQEGGVMVMPSGAEIVLPTVSSPRTLVLDPVESCVVLDDEGKPDHEVWGSFPVFPEGVPVGETRSYQLPAGAVLEWAVGYENPWK